jgi:hypothetical protein
MKCALSVSAWLFVIMTGCVGASADAPASTSAPAPSPCLMPYIKDNLIIKADIVEADLPKIDQKPFRVYVYSAFSVPLTGISLAVASDQYDSQVTPSPAWKSHPDLAAANKGGKPEYFTVSLTRKKGAAGPCDVFLKV